MTILKHYFPSIAIFVLMGNDQQGKVRPVFREKALQSQFDRDGYVHLKEFLNQEEVEGLKKAFFDLLPESGGAMTADETDFKSEAAITYDFTFIDRNWEYKQKVFDHITTVFQEKYEPILADFTPIIANFIRKGQDGGEVPLHQNWAFVDEYNYTSVSVWVPLVDSNRQNGTLEITPGSHKRFGRWRGPMVPWELEGIKRDIIEDFMVPMEATAGDAVILDDSVVHYSNINRTDGLRLTIQLILIPKGVAALHYHLDRAESADEVRVLEVDRDFFMKFHPWKRPEGKLIGKEKVELRSLSRAEFEAQLKGPKFDADHEAEREALEIAKKAEEPTSIAENQREVPEPQGFFAKIKRMFA